MIGLVSSVWNKDAVLLTNRKKESSERSKVIRCPVGTFLHKNCLCNLGKKIEQQKTRAHRGVFLGVDA